MIENVQIQGKFPGLMRVKNEWRLLEGENVNSEINGEQWQQLSRQYSIKFENVLSIKIL